MRFLGFLLLAALLTGCGTTSRMQLSGPSGIVLLTEIKEGGMINDQRVLVPGEVEATKIKEWQVRRPDRNSTMNINITERGKSVLQRTLPPGALGFVATRNEAWEFKLLAPPRANPPPGPVFR